MTINATASILLSFLLAVAKGRGTSWKTLSGTIQNDILKEYAARGTYAFPPKPSLRLVTDVFAFCLENVPRWNTISISGYHIREAGATAVQEIAFTLADGLEYLAAAKAAGLDPVRDRAAAVVLLQRPQRLSRGDREVPGRAHALGALVAERFGITDPRASAMRFHTQTAGSTLTAQQPDVNVVRVAIQALAAVLGGTQSLHTNGKDEALSLPTEASALLALRTQQVIAHETGVARIVDPLGGSWADRGADGESRGERGRAHPEDRRDGRRAQGDRGRLLPARDPGERVAGPARDRAEGADRRGRQRVRVGGGARDSDARRRSGRGDGSGSHAFRRCARGAIRPRPWRGGARHSSRRLARDETSCRRSWMRSRTSSRSARSSSRCVRSSAIIARPPPGERGVSFPARQTGIPCGFEGA